VSIPFNKRQELAQIKPKPRLLDPKFQYHPAASHADGGQAFRERQRQRADEIKERK
jgi:hypothetical protein